MSARIDPAALPQPGPGESFADYLYRATGEWFGHPVPEKYVSIAYGKFTAIAGDVYLDTNREFAELMTRLTARDFFVTGTSRSPRRR